MPSRRVSHEPGLVHVRVETDDDEWATVTLRVAGRPSFAEAQKAVYSDAGRVAVAAALNWWYPHRFKRSQFIATRGRGEQYPRIDRVQWAHNPAMHHVEPIRAGAKPPVTAERLGRTGMGRTR